MHFLDANFFTALPSIIIGMICMGIVYFLIFGLISKASGKSIGYRGGITYKGGTLADPDTLDNVAISIRKAVDKKYKIKKKIQEELAAELNTSLSSIEKKISFISYLRQFSRMYRVGTFAYDNQRSEAEYQILSYLGKTNYFAGSDIEKITNEDLLKLEKLNIELYKEKQEIEAQIKAKYEHKINELYKYL